MSDEAGKADGFARFCADTGGPCRPRIRRGFCTVVMDVLKNQGRAAGVLGCRPFLRRFR